MIRKPSVLLGLLLALAFTVAGCTGGVPSASWPGLRADDQLAFVAFNEQLHAVNLSDGREAWAFPATPDAGKFGLVFAAPGLSDDMLIVGSEGPANSFSGALFGLNPATGQQQWCLAFDKKGGQRLNCPLADASAAAGLFAAPSDSRVLGGIALSDGIGYVGLANGKVFAVEAATGKVQWHFSAEHAVWATPVVAERTVYVASLDHFVYALDRATGELQWKADMGAAVAGTPALTDGTLYVGNFGNRLAALDAGTGDEKWSVKTQNWVWGGPTVADGTVYFTDLSGAVTAVDAGTGEKKWSVTPGGVMTASPVVTADALYIGDRTGKLFALDPATGATKSGWPVEVGGELLGTPIVVGDLILTAPFQGDNLLAAYFTANSSLKWAFAPTKK